ncbi:MAG TPA: hypothetical protein ENI17_12220 [Pseudomonas xinjiangensis]|uniref:Uncharacterized protein n=1 Tax=Halopseudomonas xinjiangensis TaxID=487184 RepID=A0A7V1BPJ9_9GAMM|nr:hypothetical protein [Halopseudomonas xinjiangensis]HEC48377.1 hypothetical protein [Halopseudomonas xinjiangensis]
MRCPTIYGLKFGKSDLDALRRIRELPRNRKLLEVSLPAGVLANIFLGNNPAQIMYNVSGTDWTHLAQAMIAASAIERNVFIQTARLQQLRAGSTPNQRQFWKAVESGCQGVLNENGVYVTGPAILGVGSQVRANRWGGVFAGHLAAI